GRGWARGRCGGWSWWSGGPPRGCGSWRPPGMTCGWGCTRLRLEGELAEIREPDLRFTVAEAAELFDAAGVELSAVAGLVERTGGGAGGVRVGGVWVGGDLGPGGWGAGARPPGGSPVGPLLGRGVGGGHHAGGGGARG